MTEITFRAAKLESGKLIIDIPPDQRGAAMNFIRKMKDCVYQMEIKVFKKKRSNNANKYFWELAGRIAADRRITPTEVYREYIPDVGDNFTISTILEKDYDRFCKAWCKEGLGWITQLVGPSDVPGKIDVMCYYGSSYYDTAQMSRLIQLAVQDCQLLGIETRPEEEVRSLLEAWA